MIEPELRSRRTGWIRTGSCAVALLLMTGCATAPDGGSIFVPVGGQQDQSTPESVDQPGADDVAPSAPSDTREADPPPRHREQGAGISPAAAGLVQQADAAFRSGNIRGGMAYLQRAQRISPDAAVIYYKMAEGYVRGEQLGRAEQFARKGISLAGTDQRLQKSGWQLLSDIRRAQGNVAGAEAAESRASAL